MVALIPILLIVIILILGNYALKPKNQKRGAFVICRRTHYKLLAFFIVFLILATVLTEIFISKINSATPLETVEFSHDDYFNSIDNQIVNHEAVDPTLLLEKRIHPAGQTLTIEWENDQYPGDGPTPFIYIERKESGDQTIEEFLYKPILIVDNYNFSNSIDVTKPIWTTNKLTIPHQSINETMNAILFYDAALLQQLTKNRQHQSTVGYSSEFRSLIIHLKIPANLEIVDTNEDFLFFVD